MLGPTAAGKSELSMALAVDLGAEIVSVDSMQIYRGMDIGTAKPTQLDRERVPHHMLDQADPDEDYTVSSFQAAGRRAIRDIHRRGAAALLTGGSGLHFRALVDPMEFPPSDTRVRTAVDDLAHTEVVAELLDADPSAADHVDLANPRRVQRAVEIIRMGGGTPSERAGGGPAWAVREYESLLPFVGLGLDPGDDLADRIEARLSAMVGAGLLDEIRTLDGRMGRNAGQAVGYKELIPVVRGQIAIDEGLRAAVASTIALAKRQRTFLRRDPRIRWLPWRSTVEGRVEEAHRALEGVEWWTS